MPVDTMREESGNEPVAAFLMSHPAVPALYMVLTLGLTMFSMQPVLIALSLAGGLAYGLATRGVARTLGALRWQLPVEREALTEISHLLNTHFTGLGPDACGRVKMDNLGISIPLTKISLLEVKDFKHVCAPRLKNTSKADYGRLGIIGGGKGTVGAALIAARSGLYMGAGRVYVELLEEDMKLDPFCPELMFPVKINIDEMDAIVIGPGLGFTDQAKQRFIECLKSKAALVIDGDALTMIAQDEEILSLVTHRFAHTVLTPHAAEAARILRLPVEEINKDRLSRALDLGILTGAVNVLKGAGTIVTQRSSVSWINPTGSPALATAGSGDALSGMIGAMFAQHFELMDCVLSAVYLHGAVVDGLNSGILAGDIAPLASTCLEELRDSYQRHFHPLKAEERAIEWEDS